MSPRPREKRLSRNVLALGWTSFFTDVSSEMIVPLLPLFLGTVLGAGAITLGLVEGSADALASILKLVSGRFADRTRRFRPWILGGYGLSSLARPLVALAAAPWHVVLVRAIDRTGKGLRTSPRDALIAATTKSGSRGHAFGFQRAMDHAGAVVGPLCAIALLELWTQDLRTIFLFAAIPGAIAMAVIAIFVREPEHRRAAPMPPMSSAELPDRELRRLLAPLAVFALGNASDLFLLLNLSGRDTGPVQLSLLWIGLHVVKSATSFGAGGLVDRFGPLPLIASGWLVYAAVYLALAIVDDPAMIAALCIVYGSYHGMTESAEKTLVARIARPDRRGAAFGWYHLTLGLLALPASLLFGVVWESLGHSAAFTMGSALAGAALVLLLVLRPGARGNVTASAPAPRGYA